MLIRRYILLFSILFCLGSGVVVFAQTGNPPTGNPPGTGNPDGIAGSQTVSLSNPLGSDVTIPGLIGRVINAILGIVGSLALVMFIYGGFTWMLAAGSSEKVKKGKDILVWAAIGLIVIFSSYALVKFVITSIGNT